MRTNVQTEAEVMDVIQAFMETYARRDRDGLMALFAQDPDSVLIGTGVDEKRVGTREIEAQANRDWAQSEYAFFELVNYDISGAGPVAWVVADMVANALTGSERVRFMVRQTFILERREGRWLIVHVHTSMPSLQQNWGESFPEEPIFSEREMV